MNLDFIKKFIVGIGEKYAESGLASLIEETAKTHPIEVLALEKALADLLPVFKEKALTTTTQVDDEVVEFLTGLEADLLPTPAIATLDETDPNAPHGTVPTP